MDKATLVGLDIEAGSRVVSALENAKVSPKVALWMITPEYEEGRLVIAASALDQTHPLRAYEKVAEILHGEFFHSQPPILILRMKDPFIQKLREIFGNTKSVAGMRLGGQTIGHRYITDAYVYKVQ
jgi:hypothetical protein